MVDYFPKKPLDYPAFVEELRELMEYSLSDDALQWSADSIGFRKWKESLLDLLARIAKVGYTDVRCDVEDRAFAYFGPGDAKHAKKVFNKAVDDTNIEMQLIIQNFKKHGDPHASGSAAVAETKIVPLEVPEKVTIPWVWRNVSVPLLIGVPTAALTNLVAGITIGGTKAGQTVIGWFAPASAPAPSLEAVPASSPTAAYVTLTVSSAPAQVASAISTLDPALAPHATAASARASAVMPKHR